MHCIAWKLGGNREAKGDEIALLPLHPPTPIGFCYKESPEPSFLSIISIKNYMYPKFAFSHRKWPFGIWEWAAISWLRLVDASDDILGSFFFFSSCTSHWLLTRRRDEAVRLWNCMGTIDALSYHLGRGSSNLSILFVTWKEKSKQWVFWCYSITHI